VKRLCQLALLLALGVPAIAAAAGDVVVASSLNSATRPQLIDEARAAHKAGDHGKAAALYRRAGEMELGPALEAALALEEEESGAFAESTLHAQQCVREATADRKLADRDRILRNCQDLELRLVPRIGYLVVEVTDRPEGAEIQVAGQGTSKVTQGVPSVVTPGAVLVKAKAPGRIVHWENVEVAAGQTKTLKVDLTPMPDGSGALTPPQKQEIRAHYQRASRDYDLGKFGEAIDEYQVIYEIDGDPVMLYNLAQAYRLAEQPEKAIQFYRRYLQRSPEARNREAVEQKIAALEKMLAEHHKTLPDL
jgi:tetratricopeptide (TPR) repeat protein